MQLHKAGAFVGSWLRDRCLVGEDVHAPISSKRKTFMTKFRTKSVAAAASALVVLGLALSPTSAMAAGVDNAVPDGSSVSIAPEGSTGKTVKVPQPGTISTNATCAGCGYLSDSGQTSITPPGGSSGTISTGFGSNMTVRNEVASLFVGYQGTSYARWNGSRPTNANFITLQDKFWTAYVGFPSIGVPGGGSFTISGSDVLFTNTVNNTRSNNHSYAGITFRGHILSYSQLSTGSFRFGSNTYTVTSDY